MQQKHPYILLAEQIKQEWIFQPEALPGTRLPTERELQKHFGVSRATVSKAMALLAHEGIIRTRTGSGAYISETAIGQGLTRSSFSETRLVGFIAPMLPKSESPHISLARQVYHGIEQRAQETGCQILTASAHFNVEREEALVEQFVRIGAEGIIIYPVDYPGSHRRSDVTADYLTRRWRETPIVLVDNGAAEWHRPMVQFDNYRLGYEMTNELLRRGHRHILFMHTAPERLHNSVHERQRGWAAALSRAGALIPSSYRGWPLALYDFSGQGETGPMETLAQNLLDLDPKPDAVIAWEDETAMALTRALQNLGVSVPQAIRVAGFDNVDIGHYFEPAFPTSSPDFRRMGELAMDILDRMITGDTADERTYLLSTSVLWREPPIQAGAVAPKREEVRG